ncbi:uncharacterized protein LOC111700336 [Eurytemora carolleeae]|uniref:uncharacterized protein LOC111700336 n=1 Tax=Eurytemora carolleeae TaxID=1294199 RepID=UPI000C77930C|nr:uncharacterized protein LOC111700336 [Eurytemora carolleeae]|eukprot:XP_023326984.1 uncharacterized protein LOC111700336 [Eurytemora affinis]
MSGKVKNRGSVSNLENSTTSLNERILKVSYISQITQKMIFKYIPKNKKSECSTGNHSAGKSSFINWYIEEHVQRTGVAIETQGFSFITSGRREMPGVVDYLSTEISTSKQKKFPLVTFVDSPGLVDGDMSYPFDVNESILWLAELCDMVFVFFDPIGQALCKRTLNIVEKISEKHSERMRFYLSKADEAGHESDRQRVMMQIVQELCKRPGLNRTGFDMPTIYIPNPTKPNRCVNQIEEVCRDIEKTINQTIQNTLNTLEKDCERIGELVDDAILEDNAAKAGNYRAYVKGGFLYLLTFTLPLALMLNLVASFLSDKFLKDLLGKDCSILNCKLYAGVFLIVLTLLLLLLARFTSRTKTTLSRKQKRALLDKQEYVRNVVKAKKKTLYTEYLQQTVSDHDL